MLQKDFGSPLVCGNNLVGIVPKSTSRGFVTNTTFYYNWIKQRGDLPSTKGNTDSTGKPLPTSPTQPGPIIENAQAVSTTMIVIIIFIVIILLLPAIIIPIKIIKHKYR